MLLSVIKLHPMRNSLILVCLLDYLNFTLQFMPKTSLMHHVKILHTELCSA